MRDVPLSVVSMKRLGVERWLREHTPWPVRPDELWTIQEGVEDVFTRVALAATPDGRDALLVMVKLLLEYVMAVQAIVVESRVRKAGWRPALPAIYYEAIEADDPDAAARTAVRRLTTGISVRNQAKVRARLALDGLVEGWRESRQNGVTPAEPSLSLGPPRALTRQWAEGRGRRVVQAQPILPDLPVLRGERPGHGRIADDMVQGLSALVADHGARLERGHARFLRRLTVGAMRRGSRLVSQGEAFLGRRGAPEILLRSMGRLESRALAVAAPRAGCVAVGEAHGGQVTGIYRRGGFPQLDLSSVDVYLVASSRQAELNRRLTTSNRLVAHRCPTVVPVEVGRGTESWQAANRKPPPRDIRTVMIVEYPLAPFAHDQALNYWPYQLELSVHLGRLLRAAGFRVVLKRHPGRLAESDGLYEPYVDATISEPFEQVYEQADAFIFPNIGTTTFGFALLTNRPIVFFDVQLRDLWEDVHAPLRKRCRVIRSGVGDDGRFRFDEDQLVGELRRPAEPPDGEFVREYMLS